MKKLHNDKILTSHSHRIQHYGYCRGSRMTSKNMLFMSSSTQSEACSSSDDVKFVNCKLLCTRSNW